MLAARFDDEACARAAELAISMICLCFGIDYLTALHGTPHVPGMFAETTKNFIAQNVFFLAKNPCRLSFHVFSGSFMMSQDIPVAKD